MSNNNSRRSFLKNAALLSAGIVGLQNFTVPQAPNKFEMIYGDLIADSKNIMKLPKGFRYRIISTVGGKMSDGLFTPGKPDGMATFKCDEDRTIIVRNHEVSYNDYKNSAYGLKNELLNKDNKRDFYDFGRGKMPALGGTSTLVYNHKTEKVETDYMSLSGTVRNCAGGPTPWNSWITCEEDVTTPFANVEKKHGYVFEVPASEKINKAKPIPIKEMGRFNHEAIAVDEKSGCVYLTEDRSDGLIYRFIPKVKEKLHEGGKLQVLKIKGKDKADTRNWNMFGEAEFRLNESFDVEWIDIEQFDNDEDDLRFIGYNELKAARFARGEGMWYGNDAIYWTCTNGGKRRSGQVWKYIPGTNEGMENETAGKLSLFAEPNDSNIINNCDNLTVAPWGDIILAEDTSNPFIVGIKPDGTIYKIAENIGFASEFCGVCFAENHNTLFVNIQHAGLTLAIDGDWMM